MRSGGLRHRIVIENDQGSSDSTLGGHVENWQPILTTRARIAEQSGREFERAQQVVAEAKVMFVIRYTAILSPLEQLQSMRIRSLDTGSVYMILYAINKDQKKREVSIYTSEGQSA